MGLLNIFFFVVATLLICDYASAGPFDSGLCPPKSKVYSKKHICHSDADCQKYGQICCPNMFNTKSCTHRAPWQQNDAKYKGVGGGSDAGRGTGVWCNGVKCSPWEVCKPDPATKRLKCQRA